MRPLPYFKNFILLLLSLSHVGPFIITITHWKSCYSLPTTPSTDNQNIVSASVGSLYTGSKGLQKREAVRNKNIIAAGKLAYDDRSILLRLNGKTVKFDLELPWENLNLTDDSGRALEVHPIPSIVYLRDTDSDEQADLMRKGLKLKANGYFVRGYVRSSDGDAGGLSTPSYRIVYSDPHKMDTNFVKFMKQLHSAHPPGPDETGLRNDVLKEFGE